MGKFVRAVAIVALIFVATPTLIVVVSSFSAGQELTFPPGSVSVDPYVSMLRSSDIRTALERSLTVGALSVVFSLVAGVLAAMALFRHRVKFRSVMTGYLMLGFSTPLVVSGMAFLVLFIRVGLLGRLWPMALAITIVNFPLLIFAVASSISNLNPELEEAAATLGAEGVQTFLFVTLPGIMPGVLTGSIMMFVFGMTEFLISLILSTVANQTLPVLMFGSLRGAVTPILAAVGGVYILIALIVVFLISRLRSLEDFLHSSE
jgi:putative spermidine/putrescine transport system permease protein